MPWFIYSHLKKVPATQITTSFNSPTFLSFLRNTSLKWPKIGWFGCNPRKAMNWTSFPTSPDWPHDRYRSYSSWGRGQSWKTEKEEYRGARRHRLWTDKHRTRDTSYLKTSNIQTCIMCMPWLFFVSQGKHWSDNLGATWGLFTSYEHYRISSFRLFPNFIYAWTA